MYVTQTHEIHNGRAQIGTVLRQLPWVRSRRGNDRLHRRLHHLRLQRRQRRPEESPRGGRREVGGHREVVHEGTVEDPRGALGGGHGGGSPGPAADGRSRLGFRGRVRDWGIRGGGRWGLGRKRSWAPTPSRRDKDWAQRSDCLSTRLTSTDYGPWAGGLNGSFHGLVSLLGQFDFAENRLSKLEGWFGLILWEMFLFISQNYVCGLIFCLDINL